MNAEHTNHVGWVEPQAKTQRARRHNGVGFSLVLNPTYAPRAVGGPR